MITSLIMFKFLDNLILATRVTEDNSELLIILVILLTLALLFVAVLVYKIYLKQESKSSNVDSQSQAEILVSSLSPNRPKSPSPIRTPRVKPLDDQEGVIDIPKHKQPDTNKTPKTIQVAPTEDQNQESTEGSIPIAEINTIDHTELVKLPFGKIGYLPTNVFESTEPLYPFVAMPEPNSIIKPPLKGKTGRKGFTEERFKAYLTKHFRTDFIIDDDHYLLVRGQIRPYEPDFSLIDKKNRNILVDIEIDEPYQGINEIENRKPTHYVGIDNERNNAFTKRGWIVLRFAEIQVHQSPDACCRFLAEVLEAINSEYRIPKSLKNIEMPQLVKHWSRYEALVWSSQRYREKYLSIENFGYTEEKTRLEIVQETEQGKAIEDSISDNDLTEITSPYETITTYTDINEQIRDALYKEAYLILDYITSITIVRPITFNKGFLKAFCFIKNANIDFKITQIKNASLESDYYIEKFKRPDKIQINDAFNLVQILNKPLRVKYVSGNTLDKSTGELINFYKYFTISDMKPVEDGVRKTRDGEFRVRKGQHFDATNLASGSTITLNYDRINEIEFLNI